MLSPYLFFLKCYFFPSPNRKEESKAIEEMLHKKSLRTQYNKKNQILSPLKNYLKSIRLIWTTNTSPSQELKPIIAWCFFSKNKESISQYLKYNNQHTATSISQEELRNYSSFFKKVLQLLQLSIAFIVVQLTCLFRKNKEQYATILLVLTEQLILFNYIKQHQTKELILLNAFEFNIYFMSLFFDNNMVKVTLVPSSNPISLYYQRVYCDTFVFTAPFQKLEQQQLKQEWSVREYQTWKPFGSNDIPSNTLTGKSSVKSIGFYSSAMKLRDILGHTNLSGNNDLKAELQLLDSLNKLLKNDPSFQLTVFLHPLEKNSTTNLDLAQTFYREMFGKDVTFGPLDQSSKQNFDMVDIGLSGFSSSQMERLYGGYKVIFTPFQFLKNYFSDDRLENISAKSEDQLFQMIEDISAMSANEYFEKFNLQEYRWDHHE